MDKALINSLQGKNINGVPIAKVPDRINLTVVEYVRLPEHTVEEAILEANSHAFFYKTPVYIFQNAIDQVVTLTVFGRIPNVSYIKVIPGVGYDVRIKQ